MRSILFRRLLVRFTHYKLVPLASLMPAILAHVLITTLGAPDAPPKSLLSA